MSCKGLVKKLRHYGRSESENSLLGCEPCKIRPHALNFVCWGQSYGSVFSFDRASWERGSGLPGRGWELGPFGIVCVWKRGVAQAAGHTALLLPASPLHCCASSHGALRELHSSVALRVTMETVYFSSHWETKHSQKGLSISWCLNEDSF